jgi:murein hydrolase activator
MSPSCRFSSIPYTLRSVRTAILFCLAAVMAALPAPEAAGAGAREGDAVRQLEELRARISAIEQAQRKTADARDRESRALREAEIAVARQSGSLEATRRDRSAVLTRTVELSARRAALAAELSSDSEALAAELRAAWVAGSEPRLKLALSQRSPSGLGRMLTWYGYLARERAGRIAQLRERLAELADVSRQLEGENERLALAEKRQAQAMAALEDARANRHRTLSALNLDLARHDREAERLRQEATTLEQLIEELRAAVADIPIPDAAPFTAQRGRLAWPVEGMLARDFGARRGAGPRSNGVLIAAERGADVKAVWHGRVAYADWLPGMGLLLILEHGDGYLSLYAHNEVLFSAVGDWVTAGQVLGQVGDSGGRDQAGLYFEIRSGTKPENPAPWFSGRLTTR